MKSKTLIAIAAASGLVVGGTTFAAAQIPAADGKITACYAKSGGNLRIIDAATTKCTTKETQVTWNQAGVPGADGADGAPGADGTDGVSGYEVVRTAKGFNDSDANSFGSIGASCPEGKKALGGGASLEDPANGNNRMSSDTFDVLWSAPYESGEGWSTGYKTGTKPASFHQIAGWVTCANVN